MNANALIPHTSVRGADADGVTVFYREAGPPNAPVVLLLHGFPNIFVSISGIDSKPG